MSRFTWFDLNWVWIGLVGSAVLLVLLFATDRLRGDRAVSRWLDPVWLAWLAPAAYALHQTEEYGIDALGRHFAFPDETCGSLGLPPYPACPIPTGFFLGVNIPGIWVLGLICALVSRRHPLVGLGVYGIFITNAFAHIETFAASGQYNPGTVTAFLVQLPLSLWAFYVLSRTRRHPIAGIAAIVIAGILISIVLLGSLKLFAAGKVSDFWMVAVQIVNPAWVLLVTFAEEWRERRRPAQTMQPKLD